MNVLKHEKKLAVLSALVIGTPLGRPAEVPQVSVEETNTSDEQGQPILPSKGRCPTRAVEGGSRAYSLFRQDRCEMNRERAHIDAVVLYRGGIATSGLLGAFGNALRETRLTAMLGFLLARRSDTFCKLFGLPRRLETITLEHVEETGRSDIRIETTKGIWIIEAKLDASNPLHQIRRYKGHRRILLTDHVPRASLREMARVQWITWRDLAAVLKSLEQTGNPADRFLCGEFRHYLEEHGVIPKKETPPEIYVRDINEPVALDLFLDAHLYECRYQTKSSLTQSRYFAPHLGWKLARFTPSIRRGFSYIAKIEDVRVCASSFELRELLRQRRGREWLKTHQERLDAFDRRWRWRKNGTRSVVLLGRPRLVFNPPVPKESVQTGRGFLSKRTLSFDELFTAWEGLRQPPARSKQQAGHSRPTAKRKRR